MPIKIPTANAMSGMRLFGMFLVRFTNPTSDKMIGAKIVENKNTLVIVGSSYLFKNAWITK